jgi:hypothetical protein
MRVSKVGPVAKVRNPYAKRILSNLAGKDPHRIFASGPSDLKKAIRGLTRSELAWRPAKGTWPIAWLAHHVCDTEVGLGFRLRLALGQSGTRFQAFDQDRWAAGLHYDRRSVADSVALYAALRRSHLELLRLSSRRELLRYGIHEERGKETVERVVHMLAGHDLNHLRQIRAIRARLRGG